MILSRAHALRFFRYGLILLAGLQAPASSAPRLYDVEVIIFRHTTPSDQGENWRSPDAGAGKAQGYFQENQFTELSASNFKLDAVRYSLQKAGAYDVLYHRAWRQLAYAQANAADYPVHSFADGSNNSIEGTIKLVRGRYLHLNVDLLLMKSVGNTPGLYSDGPGNTATFRLSEKRRIKSSELHYFDHPRFGLLAVVTPYQTPSDRSAGNGASTDTPQADAVPVTEALPAN